MGSHCKDSHCNVSVDSHCKVRVGSHCKDSHCNANVNFNWPISRDFNCKVRVGSHCKVRVTGISAVPLGSCCYTHAIVCSLVAMAGS